MANIIPLDSPLRTTPIHPLLPDIRVPGSKKPQDKDNQETKEQNEKPLKPHHHHPMTCAPIPLDNDTEEKQQLDALRREYPSPEDALKEQEQVTREAKRRIEAATKKHEEVQKAMDKKVKERNTEMKVLSKYQEVKASDILPSWRLVGLRFTPLKYGESKWDSESIKPKAYSLRFEDDYDNQARIRFGDKPSSPSIMGIRNGKYLWDVAANPLNQLRQPSKQVLWWIPLRSGTHCRRPTAYTITHAVYFMTLPRSSQRMQDEHNWKHC